MVAFDGTFGGNTLSLDHKGSGSHRDVKGS